MHYAEAELMTTFELLGWQSGLTWQRTSTLPHGHLSYRLQEDRNHARTVAQSSFVRRDTKQVAHRMTVSTSTNVPLTLRCQREGKATLRSRLAMAVQMYAFFPSATAHPSSYTDRASLVRLCRSR